MTIAFVKNSPKRLTVITGMVELFKSLQKNTAMVDE
jgi:hypothetical protein